MNRFSPQKNNTCAVVITYHPDSDIYNHISDLSKQMDSVIIVDNKSLDSEINLLKDAQKNIGCELILNQNNLGIAAALNQGIEKAITSEYKWVLLMDQDSDISTILMETLLESYMSYPQREALAAIGSNYTHSLLNTPGEQYVPNGDYPWAEKKTVITSGCLLSVENYKEIGPFREDFFIDHVDDEYCLRAWKMGFKVILAIKPVMVHKMGAITTHKLFGKDMVTTNHSPLRRYYMTRNHTALIKEYFFKEFKWVRKTVYIRLVAFILLCLFEQQKIPKVKNVIKGFFHGLFNVNLKRHKFKTIKG